MLLRLWRQLIEKRFLSFGCQDRFNIRISRDGWLRFLEALLQIECPLVSFAKNCLVNHRDDVGILTIVRSFQAFLKRCTEYICNDFGRSMDSSRSASSRNTVAERG